MDNAVDAIRQPATLTARTLTHSHMPKQWVSRQLEAEAVKLLKRFIKEHKKNSGEALTLSGAIIYLVKAELDLE